MFFSPKNTNLGGINLTQIQFNLNMDFLKEAVIKSDIEAVTKSAIVLVLNEFMEKERDDYLKADAYERTDSRRDYRNGYYERDLTIPIGKITLRVPRTREGGFSTAVFEKYSRCEQSFITSMLEMVIHGVSTRRVTKIVEQLCGESVSKSFVSTLTKKLDPVIKEWNERPLNITYYPYIFVDAMYIKVREHHKVVSKAVYIAEAINKGNKREILGFKVDHVESYDAWCEFFKELKSRGLASPKLVISDAHQGLIKAIQREFIGTSWQRCTVHFKRNLFDKLPKKDSADIKLKLKRIFEAITPEDAYKFKEEFINDYHEHSKLKDVIKLLEDGFEDSIQYLNEPEKIRRYIHSTNHLERVNQEVRRRDRVIRIYPNSQSAFRLIGAILMDMDEEYSKRRPIINPNLWSSATREIKF